MDFGFKEHLATILRHRGKAVLVVLGALLITGAMALLSSKVYVSEARILILNSSPAERASRVNTSDTSGSVSSPQEQVLTQVAIFKSPALAEKLALQLGPQRVLDELTWRWDWLRAVPNKIKNLIILKLYGWDLTADLLREIGIRHPAADISEMGAPISPARDKILDALHAEAIIKTDMFGVAFASPSPEFAAEALNVLIDIYVGHVVSLRRPVDTAAIAHGEAERLEDLLADADHALREYSAKHDIMSIERQKNLLLERRSRLADESASARRAVLESDQKRASIEAQIETLPRNESISVTIRPNPVVDRLRERLSQLQTESQRFVSGGAAANRLRREIESISNQLESEAQAVSGPQTTGTSSLYQQLKNTVALEVAEREALAVRSVFLQREQNGTDAELRRIGKHELQYRQLEREVEAREDAFRYAQQKREETAIQARITEPNQAQVVPVELGSVPDKPAKPRRGRLLGLGLIMGLMSGIGLAYVLEFARSTVATSREAELALGLPVLAITLRDGLFSRRLPQTRREMRRFAVWLQHKREAGKSFWITLAAVHSQSGQSFLVSELARALWQQGVHVLILKLEVASIATEPGDPQPAGENNRETRYNVQQLRAPAWEMARHVQSLLRARADEDEVVLIDAPDFTSFPEQGTLAEMTDAVIPVVEADRTRLVDIRKQLKDLGAMGTWLPGIALTKRRQARSSWAFSWMAMTQRKARERTI